MNYVLITGFALFMFLVLPPASAQQTEPTPTAVPAAPAKVEPVSEAQVAALTRMELCTEVKNRQPVDSGTTFSADQDKVYCYLEFGGGKKDSIVTVVWKYGAK